MKLAGRTGCVVAIYDEGGGGFGFSSGDGWQGEAGILGEELGAGLGEDGREATQGRGAPSPGAWGMIVLLSV